MKSHEVGILPIIEYTDTTYPIFIFKSSKKNLMPFHFCNRYFLDRKLGLEVITIKPKIALFPHYNTVSLKFAKLFVFTGSIGP